MLWGTLETIEPVFSSAVVRKRNRRQVRSCNLLQAPQVDRAKIYNDVGHDGQAWQRD